MKQLLAIGLGLVAAASGCIPTRVVWSPDGRRAAVTLDTAVHLCDPSGKLTPWLTGGVKMVSWMPDNRRVLAVVSRDTKTWKEIAPLLAETERNDLVSRAEAHRADAGTARRLLAAYEKARDLINIGAYVEGSDPDIDAALTILPALNAFLQQPSDEFSTISDTLTMMMAIRQGSEAGNAT